LEIQPDHFNALYSKANASSLFKKYGEALVYYDKVLDMYPEDSNALSGKGDALLGLRRYGEAIAYYDKIDPSDIGVFLDSLKNRDLALNAMNKTQDDKVEPTSEANVTTNNTAILIE